MLGVGLTEVCLAGNPQDRHGAETWAAAYDLCVCQSLKSRFQMVIEKATPVFNMFEVIYYKSHVLYITAKT